MNTLRHSVEIKATKETVWQVLWDDKTFRDWANIIDPGTYMTGELQEGNEVNFIGNSDDGVSFGVTSRVEKLIPYSHISFEQVADITVGNDGSIKKRKTQWTGGKETYELEEHDDTVTLSHTQDVPDELVTYFNDKLPQALKRIKSLAETL